MTYLTIAAMLLFVLLPVVVPAIITGVHTVAQWRSTYGPARTASSQRGLASRRGAVPAAA